MYTETNWQTAIEIDDYKTYASSSMLFFTVPELTVKSMWQFNAYRSPEEKCDLRTLLLFFQPGSFPVINPLNESFPEDFNIVRTELKSFELISDNNSTQFVLENPIPGGWYVKAYLGDYIDDSIKLKGVSIDCKYYMGTIHVVEVLDNVQEIPVSVSIQVQTQMEIMKIYRFHTNDETWQYEITIDKCKVNGSEDTLSPCPISLATRALALPLFDGSSSNTIDCSDYNSSQCVMRVTAPATMNWQYIAFKSTMQDEEVEFDLSVTLHTCNSSSRTNMENNNQKVLKQVFDSLTIEPGRQSDVKTSIDIQTDIKIGDYCVFLSELGRFEIPTKILDVEFKLRVGVIYPISGSIVVPENKPLVLHFNVLPGIDVGATLKYQLSLDTKYLDNPHQLVQVNSCIQRLGIPMSAKCITCHSENFLQVNSSTDLAETVQLYFPYPEPGPWYITLMARCYNASNHSELEVCEQSAVSAVVTAELKPCVDSVCGDYGTCYTYYSAHHRYSSCKCVANYRGYGCTDNTVADTDTLQLASALLLTLSNLLFLPAIIVSIYRRFYPEALSYTYTMFFSTFYHACDGSRTYIYCIMPFNVLSYCDFFGAIVSVFVTLVALSQLGEKLRGFLFLLSSLFIAMGVTWDKFSFWTFAIPAIVGLLIMTASWSRNCYSQKECFPDKRHWLLHIIPGLSIATAGMVVYGFFETEANYWYTHSFWHACMALCIVFLLPSRQQTDKEPSAHSKTTKGEETGLLPGPYSV